MEKKRLEFLYYSFSMYINIISTGTSEDQEVKSYFISICVCNNEITHINSKKSYERFWKYLDKYDPIGDMQSFITQKGTGPKIPGKLFLYIKTRGTFYISLFSYILLL